MQSKRYKYTLFEIVIVMTIIITLLSIVGVALNDGIQFTEDSFSVQVKKMLEAAHSRAILQGKVITIEFDSEKQTLQFEDIILICTPEVKIEDVKDLPLAFFPNGTSSGAFFCVVENGSKTSFKIYPLTGSIEIGQ